VTQRRVILLRHGHAEESRDDFARPLSDTGRAAAERAGSAIERAGWCPDRVLTSPAPRARETAEIAARACGFAGSIASNRDLYLASGARYLAALRDLSAGASSVLLVGHNPGLSELARTLCRHPGELAPAAFASAAFEIDGWEALEGAEPAASVGE
jgi:phosphohistidine phosphatase